VTGAARDTPGLREHPLWWDSADFPAAAETALPASAELVVIGGGYTGMSAAREASRRGTDVVLIDEQRLGQGASSRNAGMVHSGVKVDVATLLRQPLGREMYQATQLAYGYVRDLIATENIDCQLTEGGQLHVAHSASRAAVLAGRVRLYEELGVPARYLGADELAEEIGCSGYPGGLLLQDGGGLHPARYWAGLARSAISSGVRAFAGVRGERWDETPSGVRVVTSGGTISARAMLVATDAYSGDFDPWLKRRILPIGSYVIATEPLDAELSGSLVRHSRMVIDTKNLLSYWRLSPDKRLLFGGRAGLAPTTVADARRHLHKLMIRAYPQLRETTLAYSWGGLVGFTRDRLPHVVRRGRVFYAAGYCGSGIALASYLGYAAGAWAAGDTQPVFARLPLPLIPAYDGRPWFMRGVGWYYQFRDLLS
jgi:glycine/D-amino acid oxidase-like deaminating enzyme